MNIILTIVLGTILYFICHWLGDKAAEWAARDPNKLAGSNGRVKDLAFFAVIGFGFFLIHTVMWAVQAVAWAVHLLV